MTHEERERLIRLQAASLHDAGDATSGIEIDHIVSFNKELVHVFYESPDGDTCLDLFIQTGRDTVTFDTGGKEIKVRRKDFDAWIALLQRARQIMGGA